MADHNDFYTNYFWWTGQKDYWLRVILIAAPLMIVFQMVLITYRLWRKSTWSYIYQPCSSSQMVQTAHCHSSVYEPVYKATTCAINETHNAADEKHIVELQNV